MQIKEGHLIEIKNLYLGGYLNFDQIDKINDMLYVLARHMFLDKETLNELCNEPTKVSYLKKASKHNMITIIKDGKKDKPKEAEFYYQLGVGGYSLLSAAGKPFNNLNVMATLNDRQKILAMNKVVLKKKFQLLYHQLHGDQSDYFFCKGINKDDIILYNDKDRTYNAIVREIISLLVKEYKNNIPIRYTIKEIEDVYRFIKISEMLKDINIKAKRDDEKDE